MLQPAHGGVVVHVARVQQRDEHIDVQEPPHQTPSPSLRASMSSFVTMTPRASKGRNPATTRCLVSSCAVLPESAWRSRSDTILPAETFRTIATMTALPPIATAVSRSPVMLTSFSRTASTTLTSSATAMDARMRMNRP